MFIFCDVLFLNFSLDDFVKLYSKKLNIDEDELRKCLWGDYYFNSKTKQIRPGAQEKAKKPMFVQFVLENIWALYDTICVRKVRPLFCLVFFTILIILISIQLFFF